MAICPTSYDVMWFRCIILWFDKVISWWRHQIETFPYRPFVRGIHRSPVNSPHKGQWHRALIFSLNYTWTYGWVNNRDAGDLRRHCVHYDATLMLPIFSRVIVLQGFRIALGQSCDCSNASEVTQEEACKLTTSWWRHQMETFSAFPAFCAGISPVTGEFPTKRAVTRSFEAFFDLRLIRQLSKQWRHRWFETPSHWSWRRCNVNQIITHDIVTTNATRQICTPAFWEYTPMIITWVQYL